MKDGGDPEDLTWEHPDVKEGAHLVLMESELKTSVWLSLLKQNSHDYCDLLEEVEFNYLFWENFFNAHSLCI